ncbi:MAG: hypothetical protein KJ971_07575, partial [Firmicutes bacterium]|nr:hypothetical protein [Bacillota bacterium]
LYVFRRNQFLYECNYDDLDKTEIFRATSIIVKVILLCAFLLFPRYIFEQLILSFNYFQQIVVLQSGFINFVFSDYLDDILLSIVSYSMYLWIARMFDYFHEKSVYKNILSRKINNQVLLYVMLMVSILLMTFVKTDLWLALIICESKTLMIMTCIAYLITITFNFCCKNESKIRTILHGVHLFIFFSTIILSHIYPEITNCIYGVIFLFGVVYVIHKTILLKKANAVIEDYRFYKNSLFILVSCMALFFRYFFDAEQFVIWYSSCFAILFFIVHFGFEYILYKKQNQDTLNIHS